MSGPNLASSSLFRSERDVLNRHAAGQDKATILRETGLSRRAVDLALSYESETGTRAMFSDLAHGSRALLAAIAREHPDRVTSR